MTKYELNDTRASVTPLADDKILLLEDTNSRPARNPDYRALIIQYVAHHTRPDVAFATQLLAKFNNNPDTRHWAAAKRLLSYLGGTADREIVYDCTGRGINIQAYSDASYATFPETRLSTTGGIILMGGGPIVHLCRRQTDVAQSSFDAEYYAAAEVTKELTWLIQFLKELRIPHHKPTVYSDNVSAIRHITTNHSQKRGRHIDIKFHFVRQQFKRGVFLVEYIPTENQIGDLLTKKLSGDRITHLAQLAGMKGEEKKRTSVAIAVALVKNCRGKNKRKLNKLL